MDLLWGKTLLFGQRILLKAKSSRLNKGAERKGHKHKPGPSHPQIGSEDTELVRVTCDGCMESLEHDEF